MKMGWVGERKTVTPDLWRSLCANNQRNSKTKCVANGMPCDLLETLHDLVFQVEENIIYFTVVAGSSNLPQEAISAFSVFKELMYPACYIEHMDLSLFARGTRVLFLKIYLRSGELHFPINRTKTFM